MEKEFECYNRNTGSGDKLVVDGAGLGLIFSTHGTGAAQGIYVSDDDLPVLRDMINERIGAEIKAKTATEKDTTMKRDIFRCAVHRADALVIREAGAYNDAHSHDLIFRTTAGADDPNSGIDIFLSPTQLKNLHEIIGKHIGIETPPAMPEPPRHEYILVMRDTVVFLVGPFETKVTASEWAVNHNTSDHPGWQCVSLTVNRANSMYSIWNPELCPGSNMDEMAAAEENMDRQEFADQQRGG